MSVMYVISVVFLNFLKSVDGKTCIRSDNIYESFTCGMYEYCCGTRCCRSPIITFYQMWYFWLMVFLTILFCSGGGWWYRLRNQDQYITPSMAQAMTYNSRPVIHPARGPTIYASTMPMANAPPRTPHCPPPPPYCGPPPSYDQAVNLSQNPNFVRNQVWNQNQNWNQNQTLNQNQTQYQNQTQSQNQSQTQGQNQNQNLSQNQNQTQTSQPN